MDLRKLCEALCVRLTIGGPSMEAPLNRLSRSCAINSGRQAA